RRHVAGRRVVEEIGGGGERGENRLSPAGGPSRPTRPATPGAAPSRGAAPTGAAEKAPAEPARVRLAEEAPRPVERQIAAVDRVLVHDHRRVVEQILQTPRDPGKA